MVEDKIMGTLSQNSIPGLGIGHLHPKLRHKYTVVIETAQEELVDSYTVLEKQCVNFDIGTENLGMPMLTHVKSSVIMWLEDDVSCLLMTALRKIQQSQDMFNITLSMLDGNESIVEQYTFGRCRPSALQHSILSYEPTGDRIDLYRDAVAGVVEIPGSHLHGTITPPGQKSAVMKLLQVEFMDYGHKILTPYEASLLPNKMSGDSSS